MPSDMDYDDQDQSEMFDEDRINPDEGTSGPDMLTFEELPDVFDVTSKVGDADVDEDETALDADELGEDDLEALSDADGEDNTLADALEDDPEENELLDADDLQAIDGLDDLEEGEAEIEYVEDTDAVAGAAPNRARVMESGGELSDADLQELGYQGEDER